MEPGETLTVDMIRDAVAQLERQRCCGLCGKPFTAADPGTYYWHPRAGLHELHTACRGHLMSAALQQKREDDLAQWRRGSEPLEGMRASDNH